MIYIVEIRLSISLYIQLGTNYDVAERAKKGDVFIKWGPDGVVPDDNYGMDDVMLGYVRRRPHHGTRCHWSTSESYVQWQWLVLWCTRSHWDSLFWVLGLFENECTFINQIDSKCVKLIYLTNENAFGFRRVKDSTCGSTWLSFLSQCCIWI